MATSFVCGNCSKPFHVGQEMAGKTGRCKRRGQLMFIPFQSTDRPVLSSAPDAGIAPEGGPAATSPAADSLPSNPVERGRVLFEAARRRRDARCQKTLGRGAASGDGAEATNPPWARPEAH